MGQYASKCPYKKEENKLKGKEKNKFNKMQKKERLKKKSFYAQEDSMHPKVPVNPLMKMELANLY